MDYQFRWDIVFHERWLSALWDGFQITMLLAMTSTLGSLLLGGMLAAGRESQRIILRYLAEAVAAVLRNVPGVYWLLVGFFAFPMLLPDMARAQINGWKYYGLFAAMIGLSVNNAPYISDILLAGIRAVSKESVQSASLLGLSGWQLWTKVILPPAFIVVLPALNARIVHNFRNTSLAMTISVPCLTWQGQEIESITFASLEVTTVVTAIYILVGWLLGRAIWLYERTLDKRIAHVQTHFGKGAA